VFTGIVEEMGKILAIEERPAGRRFWIGAARVMEDTQVGSSIAVGGCCLTVVAAEPARFAVEAVPETLSRTVLGEVRLHDAVNLERAMRVDERLGGHLMQGHVDGVGTVVTVLPEGDGKRVAIEVPENLARFVAEKGSLAVDGVSLTVAAASGTHCEVALIPHTLAVTTSGSYAPGRRVNLEVDLIARYLARLLDERAAERRAP
jgi:riboflavin synthase